MLFWQVEIDILVPSLFIFFLFFIKLSIDMDNLISNTRPHPNECSGSDLDGDIYFVCWDSELIPPRTIEPMEYDSAQPIVLDHDVEIEVLSFELYIHMHFFLYFLYGFSNLCNVIFLVYLTFFSVFISKVFTTCAHHLLQYSRMVMIETRINTEK
jgi:hypothetical protein